MRFFWISRWSHLEMVGVLKDQIAELSEERRVLLDRLATLGLGGPLFASTGAVEAAPAADTGSDMEETASELEQLSRLRRRPSQLAEALTRKAHRDTYKSQAPNRVSRVAANEAVAALDQALEAAGKSKA